MNHETGKAKEVGTNITPAFGIAGMVTPVTFSGVNNSDFVVLSSAGCAAPQSVSTGADTLAKTTLALHKVSTTVAMNSVASLSVCFATQQSGGDSPDDYVTLAAPLSQLDVPAFDPVRLIKGTAQVLVTMSSFPSPQKFFKQNVFHPKKKIFGQIFCSAKFSGGIFCFFF